MSYNKTTWKNYPSTDSPINASNLNKIEAQLKTNETSNSTTQSQLDSLIAAFDDKVKAFILDKVYPVGTIYITKDGSFNPNNALGGTWSLIHDRFLVGAGNAYELGETGGSSYVTLTVNNLPSHTHTFTGTSTNTSVENNGHYHSIMPTGTVVSVAGSAGEHSHSYSKKTLGSRSTFVTGGEKIYPVESASLSDTSSNGNHTHTITSTFKGIQTYSGENQTSHVHTIAAKGVNSSTGGGERFFTRPPYRAVNMWVRTK